MMFFNKKTNQAKPFAIAPYSAISQDGYSTAQKESYIYIKNCIDKGIYVDVGENEQYLYDYINYLFKEPKSNAYSDSSNVLLRNFIGLYSGSFEKVTNYALVLLVFLDLYESTSKELLLADLKSLYSSLKQDTSLAIGRGGYLATVYRYAHDIGSTTKISNEFFFTFAQYNWKEFLTDYGIDNATEICNLVGEVLDDDFKNNKVNYLYRLYTFKPGTLYGYCYETDEYLDSFWNNQAEFTNRQLRENDKHIDGILVPERNKEQIVEYLSTVVREAENRYRQKKGLPRVGEGWISESLLFRRIEAAFPDEMVMQHASPSFLGRQHYDVFFPEKNIALEYQGAQHFEAVDFFGGEEAFEKGKLRDERKKRLSKENNVLLIEVLPEYDLSSLIEELVHQLAKQDSKYENYEEAFAKAFLQAQKIDAEKEVFIKSDINNELQKKNIKKADKKSNDEEIDKIIQELVSKKKPSAKTRLFNRVEGDEFDKGINQYYEIEQLRKTNPKEALAKGMFLISEGLYAAPAIYESMAKILRSEKRLEEELDLLLQMKCDFDYPNFDTRIRNLYKKINK